MRAVPERTSGSRQVERRYPASQGLETYPEMPEMAALGHQCGEDFQTLRLWCWYGWVCAGGR